MTMPSDKQLLGIRLDHEEVKEIDAIIEKLAAPMPAPSRNVVLTQVIREWVKEQREKIGSEKK
jgi:hypothetical protein